MATPLAGPELGTSTAPAGVAHNIAGISHRAPAAPPRGTLAPELAELAGAELREVAPEERERARGAYAYYVHGNLQELVRFTDQKAATIIGAGGIIVAVLGNNLIERFRADPVSRWAGLVSLALMVVSIACAVGVLWPRVLSGRKVATVPGAPRLLWAADIAAYTGRSADYLRALLAVGPGEVLADLANESLKVSSILQRKLRWQRWATQILGVAFLSWLVTIGLALTR
jgi:hypothetical protein